MFFTAVSSETTEEQLSCLTGTVNFEVGSGMVTYDDTHTKLCGFGETKCYKQTLVVNVDGWLGRMLIYVIIVSPTCIAYKNGL